MHACAHAVSLLTILLQGRQSVFGTPEYKRELPTPSSYSLNQHSYMYMVYIVHVHTYRVHYTCRWQFVIQRDKQWTISINHEQQQWEYVHNESHIHCTYSQSVIHVQLHDCTLYMSFTCTDTCTLMLLILAGTWFSVLASSGNFAKIRTHKK